MQVPTLHGFSFGKNLTSLISQRIVQCYLITLKVSQALHIAGRDTLQVGFFAREHFKSKGAFWCKKFQFKLR